MCAVHSVVLHPVEAAERQRTNKMPRVRDEELVAARLDETPPCLGHDRAVKLVRVNRLRLNQHQRRRLDHDGAVRAVCDAPAVHPAREHILGALRAIRGVKDRVRHFAKRVAVVDDVLTRLHLLAKLAGTVSKHGPDIAKPRLCGVSDDRFRQYAQRWTPPRSWPISRPPIVPRPSRYLTSTTLSAMSGPFRRSFS